MNTSLKTTVRFKEPLTQLLEGLETRSQDIIRRRFGLESGTRETLESIGHEYGITRERVRQIEAHAMRLLENRLGILDEVAQFLADLFRTHGGILTLHQVVVIVRERTGIEVLPTLVSFYLELLSPYEYRVHDPAFVAHWRYPEYIPSSVEEVVKTAQRILTERKEPIEENVFLETLRMQLGASGTSLLEVYVLTWLSASRHITKNPFGEWGLVGWAEMTPRGVGDKAYAVLRRHAKPEHFRTIAQMINDAKFDRKTANPQTVHNELIKDTRFVLVGRGLYGLAQWGYVPGTVADVIETVLRDAKKALSRDEIVERVLAQRLVKKNTIVLSLQDYSRFVKDEENRYTLNKKL